MVLFLKVVVDGAVMGRWRRRATACSFQFIIGDFVATATASIVRCYELIFRRDFGIVVLNLNGLVRVIQQVRDEHGQ
jgi:hypothetical protein